VENQENDAQTTEQQQPQSGQEASPARRSRRGRRRRGGGSGGSGGEAAALVKAPATAKGSEKPKQLMVVNVAEGDECRIAILNDGKLEELYIERASAVSHVGNIYKGRVTNVEPSIQAAFVDFGLGKNGFLHISDLQPQYFPNNRGELEEVGRKTPRRERPPIQRCLRRGQEVIVQITKEGIGTKGPTLTTYISLPGRYLVMMPGMNRLGVSRKIEDDAARRKMREILDQLDLPSGMGFILRTAGMDRTKRELQRDLQYLMRLWKSVAKRIRNERAPAELYQESDLVIRTIRDVFTNDFDKIIVDDPAVAQRARDFISIVSPRKADVVELYEGSEPLFHKYGIEAEIEKINSRRVQLPSGGSLVIDTTEALVAIDVNSGTYREQEDPEATAYKINMEAAEEIARQLRLRDLGGVIIIDFIDMRSEKHRRELERALREALKKHKERARMLRMSQFGIIELTRQRQRPSIKRSIYQDCPHCKGAGLIKTTESMVLDVMRLLRLAAHQPHVARVQVTLHPTVAFELLNRKRTAIAQLETDSKRAIRIEGSMDVGLDEFRIECRDARDRVVEFSAGTNGQSVPPPLPPVRPPVRVDSRRGHDRGRGRGQAQRSSQAQPPPGPARAERPPARDPLPPPAPAESSEPAGGTNGTNEGASGPTEWPVDE